MHEVPGSWGSDLGFRGLGFMVQGLGFRIYCKGVWACSDDAGGLDAVERDLGAQGVGCRLWGKCCARG